MEVIDITLQVDKESKERAKKLFNKLGLSLSIAFNAFLKQSIQKQKPPFEVTIGNEDQPITATEKEVKQAYEEEIKERLNAYRKLGK